MQVYERIVKDRVVVLDEGSRVEVRVRQTDRESNEELLKQRLGEVGLLVEIRERLVSTPQGDRTPVSVSGRPLSQAIIADRR